MEIITLESGIALELEMPAYDRGRIIDSLNRGEFVVVSSHGSWRASFDYRTDALDFGRNDDKVLAPSGAVVLIVARAQR